MKPYRNSKRRIGFVLLGLAICAHFASAHAGQAGFGSTNLSQTIERAFTEVVDAIQVLVRQGPGAFLDVVKQWFLTLANAIINVQSN